jgi:hypothetical protein
MRLESNMVVTPTESQNITREKLKKFLPKGSSVQVTDEILDTIRNMERDISLPQGRLDVVYASCWQGRGSRSE